MNKYTAKNFRYTSVGWVVDVRYDGAMQDVSIPAYDINAQDCRNFDAVYRTSKTLPYIAQWGQVFEIGDRAEQKRQAAEIAADAEWLDTDASPKLPQIVGGVSSPEWWDAQEERSL
jgi:hypothetical protein